MTKTKGNPDIRLAFRFIKLCVLTEDNEMPKPTWAEFDEHDTFDSVIQGSIARTGYTSDGDSKVERMIMFFIGDDVVAIVILNGIQCAYPEDNSWTVDRVLYRESWHPYTGAEGEWLEFHADAFGGTYTTAVLINALNV